MGCVVSWLGLASRKTTEVPMENVSVEQLNGEQIDMIKESWKVIQKEIAKVGVILFVRLFETHPECKDVFFLFRDVKGMEEFHNSKTLRAHGLRVMSFIEKSVARLDQIEKLDSLAVELGRSHYFYNAPSNYYGYVGEEFITVVGPILKDQWTPALEAAWKSLFQYVTELMRKGNREEEAKQNNTPSSNKKQPDKNTTVL